METDQTQFGEKVIAKALSYANHKWYATKRNIMHGMDADGKPVETPDVSWRGKELDCGWWKAGQFNTGIPYSWGNMTTLEEFDQGIESGKYAGNVPEDKSRVPSQQTVGIDCSGLLSVCWDLPQRILTKDIPDIAEIVEKLDDIRPGDVFAVPGRHVMIFKEFVDDKSSVRIIDATRSIGKVSQRDISAQWLFEQEYRIYRKR